MNRTFLVIGLAVASAMAGALLYLNRGAHLVLEGSIQKLRIHPLDEQSTLVIADFRAHNPSDTLFVVNSVDVFIDSVEGSTVSELDARRIFQAMPELGPKYNPSLIARDRIDPRETVDRMIAARLELPDSEVNAAEYIRIRVTDVDGTWSEIRRRIRLEE